MKHALKHIHFVVTHCMPTKCISGLGGSVA